MAGIILPTGPHEPWTTYNSKNSRGRMMAHPPIAMKIKIQPWQTPNFLIGEMPARPRQEGFNPDSGPKWALSEVDAETLANQCDQFRAEVFRKAGKTDPKAKETQ